MRAEADNMLCSRKAGSAFYEADEARRRGFSSV